MKARKFQTYKEEVISKMMEEFNLLQRHASSQNLKRLSSTLVCQMQSKM